MTIKKLFIIQELKEKLKLIEKEILKQRRNAKVYLPFESKNYEDKDFDFITMEKLICAYHTWCDPEMDEWNGLNKEAVYILNFIGEWAHQRKIIQFIVEYCDAKGFDVKKWTKKDAMEKYDQWKKKEEEWWGNYEDDFIIEDAYTQYLHYFHKNMGYENDELGFQEEIKQCIMDIKRSL